MTQSTARRLGFLAISLACAAMMGAALYLQYYRYLNPCPLCMFQRVFVIAVGAISLLAALHGRAPRVYALSGLLFGGIGFAIAVRHTLLQYFPPKALPECGAGLFRMMETTPFGDVVAQVLRGTGECAVIDWSMLGLSLPGWSAIGFAGLLAGIAMLGFHRRFAG
ncbi:disulfide bond formation protein B [Chitinimonas sp.]|uniref:disulfide bond formation protein B n=1 Tax=Chitinimonas sp. TaxID=1934313 RepID=UPI0035B36FAB